MTSPTSVDRIKGLASGLGVKAPVATAATANVAALAGLQTIGGIVTTEGMRVLLTAQTDATQGGIWNASTGPWTRAADFDGRNDVVNGTLVVVAGGDSSGAIYKVVGVDPIAPGTSAITFVLAMNMISVSAVILSLLACADLPAVKALLGFAAITGDTFTGDVTLGAGRKLIFEGTTDDGFETTLTAADPSVDRTVTIQNADYILAGLNIAQLFTANQRPNYDNTQAVAAGGTFTYNGATMAQELLITGTGAGAITLAAPSNVVEGLMYKLIFKAGDTSARTLSWNVAWKFPTATPTLTALSTTSGAYDSLTFVGGPGNTMILDGGKDVR